ncbi:MAG: hypothetical protein JO324_00960 [Candidatus Eremiobacteraeota bacterium]|nr:hypothetical protein [Candidatus Eremiobacteraeota bacterium]
MLYAVADLSARDAWAVGAWPARSPYLTDTLAEHWNGTQWSIVHTPRTRTPTAQLNSIAALASNAMWAAGYAENPGCICGQTVVDYWNGSAWTRLKTPNPGIADFLAGISAVSAEEIWAVGSDWPNQSYDVPLILRWDGKQWTPLALSQYQLATLYSVYAPAHDDAWAFGFWGSSTTLVLHWDGTSWTRIPFSDTVQIISISGTSPSDIWAAGYYYCGSSCNPIAKLYHWDGIQWSAVSIAGFGEPSVISGISAVAANDAWFTGYGTVFPKWQNYVSNVTYHWDGKSWKDVTNPDQIGCCVLNAISARRGDAWVVGQGGDKGSFSMHYGKR